MQAAASQLRTQAPHVPDDPALASLNKVRAWIEERDYAGYEPYDILNAPALANVWSRNAVLSSVLIQVSKRVGGMWLRKLLRVPPSKNPKALALILAAYCDLLRLDAPCREQAMYVQGELLRLRSKDEAEYCWGYDWNYISLRGSAMAAFSPNSIATVFAGSALLDFAEITGDRDSLEAADSVARFLVTRLNRSRETAEEVCFSYTPNDHTLIYNNSALIAAYLARVAARTGSGEYRSLARRALQYLVNQQRQDGSWTYGAGRLHQWVDGFHTGYNLGALLAYTEISGDSSFATAIERGYAYYVRKFFRDDMAPGYFSDRFYPIDIHSCAQAILTFCDFAGSDAGALDKAAAVAAWTARNMQSREGFFYYQQHRFHIDRTAYMRWAQAWMFHALARLRATQSRQAPSR